MNAIATIAVLAVLIVSAEARHRPPDTSGYRCTTEVVMGWRLNGMGVPVPVILRLPCQDTMLNGAWREV